MNGNDKFGTADWFQSGMPAGERHLAGVRRTASPADASGAASGGAASARARGLLTRRAFVTGAAVAALAAAGAVAGAGRFGASPQGASASEASGQAGDAAAAPVQSNGSAVPDDDVQGVLNAQSATTYFTDGQDGFFPAGSGGYAEGEGNPTQREAAESAGGAAASADSAQAAGASDGPAGSQASDTPAPRVVLAFFSRPRENNYGTPVHIDIPVGYTEVVAGYMADALQCDTFKIEAADSYDLDYTTIVERNVQEERSDARPEVANLDALPDLAAYDTVIVGSPVWNSQPPMIMRTFLESLDLAGKTVAPFTTYDMSRLGSTERVYKECAPDATIADGLAVYEKDANEPDGRDQALEWLAGLGLLAG